MDQYSELLARAIKTIVEQFGKRSLGNLLSNRGAKLTGTSKRVKAMEDFELITWFVLKSEAQS